MRYVTEHMYSHKDDHHLMVLQGRLEGVGRQSARLCRTVLGTWLRCNRSNLRDEHVRSIDSARGQVIKSAR